MLKEFAPNIEEHWCQRVREEGMVRSAELFLSRFERLKDIDPRTVVRHYAKGEYFRSAFYLGRLTLKELLYETYRHTLGRNKSLIRPIFIVGHPHSGTTIASKLLGLHSDLSTSDELNTYWHPGNYFDFKNCEHERKAEDATDKEIKRLHQRLEFERWLRGNHSRFINKNPNNTVTVSFLRKVFPDCFIVHVVRDALSVVNSMLHGLPYDVERYDRYLSPEKRISPWAGVKPPKWREYLNPDPVIQHAHQWKLSVEYILSREKTLLPNFIQLKYEDLCLNTHEVIANIWRCAGLSVKVNQFRHVPSSLVNQNFKYRSQLTSDDIQHILGITAETRHKLGYLDEEEHSVACA